ncbi:MAG: TIGR03790 family protein [Chthonomonas sp.]|nr:TIGR03790 family protein [Chthonomonas sp.]
MLFFALLLVPSPADRVLVIQNQDSPASIAISTDYMKKRSVKNLLKVSIQDSNLSAANETLGYSKFQEFIEKPLKSYLAKNQAIDFIVLTKGIPLRLTGAPFGVNNNRPSLDSAIASFGYEKRTDVAQIVIDEPNFKGKCWANRFWNSKERFSHAKFGGYLVTRLDAYSADEARALTAYALASEKARPKGKFLIDVAQGHGLGNLDQVPIPPTPDGKLGQNTMSDMTYKDWDADLVVAGRTLEAKHLTTQVDRTEDFIGRMGDLAGYASWGSNDPKFNAENYLKLRFEPGAIGETAVSTSARTFLPTRGGQSLIADLVHGRITGVKGYCDEPLLTAVASPTVLFDRYTGGWTLAESFYAASRYVGWEDIVIGDPLCAPYR